MSFASLDPVDGIVMPPLVACIFTDWLSERMCGIEEVTQLRLNLLKDDVTLADIRDVQRKWRGSVRAYIHNLKKMAGSCRCLWNAARYGPIAFAYVILGHDTMKTAFAHIHTTISRNGEPLRDVILRDFDEIAALLGGIVCERKLPLGRKHLGLIFQNIGSDVEFSAKELFPAGENMMPMLDFCVPVAEYDFHVVFPPRFRLLDMPHRIKFYDIPIRKRLHILKVLRDYGFRVE